MTSWQKILIVIGVVIVFLTMAGFAVIQSSETKTRVGSEEEFSNSPVDSLVDISDWQTYRSDQHGFEIKVPQKYTIEEKTSRRRDSSFGFYISLTENSDSLPVVEIRGVSLRENKDPEIFFGSGHLSELINTLSDPEKHTRKYIIYANNREIPTFFFDYWDPFSIGRVGSSTVSLVEEEQVFLIISKLNVNKPDGEFRSILESLRFYDPQKELGSASTES